MANLNHASQDATVFKPIYCLAPEDSKERQLCAQCTFNPTITINCCLNDEEMSERVHAERVKLYNILQGCIGCGMVRLIGQFRSTPAQISPAIFTNQEFHDDYTMLTVETGNYINPREEYSLQPDPTRGLMPTSDHNVIRFVGDKVSILIEDITGEGGTFPTLMIDDPEVSSIFKIGGGRLLGCTNLGTTYVGKKNSFDPIIFQVSQNKELPPVDAGTMALLFTPLNQGVQFEVEIDALDHMRLVEQIIATYSARQDLAQLCADLRDANFKCDNDSVDGVIMMPISSVGQKRLFTLELMHAKKCLDIYGIDNASKEKIISKLSNDWIKSGRLEHAFVQEVFASIDKVYAVLLNENKYDKFTAACTSLFDGSLYFRNQHDNEKLPGDGMKYKYAMIDVGVRACLELYACVELLYWFVACPLLMGANVSNDDRVTRINSWELLRSSARKLAFSTTTKHAVRYEDRYGPHWEENEDTQFAHSNLTFFNAVKEDITAVKNIVKQHLGTLCLVNDSTYNAELKSGFLKMI